MTNDGHTYFAFKRLLFAYTDLSHKFHLADANGMIYEACEAALDTLEDADRAHIEDAIDTLMERMKQRSFGRKGALELLASVAWYLGGGG